MVHPGGTLTRILRSLNPKPVLKLGVKVTQAASISPMDDCSQVTSAPAPKCMFPSKSSCCQCATSRGPQRGGCWLVDAWCIVQTTPHWNLLAWVVKIIDLGAVVCLVQTQVDVLLVKYEGNVVIVSSAGRQLSEWLG